ncbi:hypothetical protein GCM10025762_17550 [Haloechinothrix salitolerans]
MRAANNTAAKHAPRCLPFGLGPPQKDLLHGHVAGGPLAPWHNPCRIRSQRGRAAHSACWGKTGPPPREGTRAATTRKRWQQIHDLLDHGAGLLEVARRKDLTLNTVTPYARTLSQNT